MPDCAAFSVGCACESRRLARRLRAVAASAVAVVAAAAGVTACGDQADGGGQVVWVVGDGGVAEASDDRVATMIEERGIDHLLYLGDVYEEGTLEEFREHYDPSFGRFKPITYPTPGNHEWPNHRDGYDRYWKALMRRNGGRHYYSFDIGAWHFVSLNSEQPIGKGSAQLEWLRRDLAEHPGDCTIAFTHSPRYTVGQHGYDDDLRAVWRVLSGEAVALFSGHDHNYQRMEPERGVMQFVVGSGGRRLYDVEDDHWRLAASDDDSFGALRLRIADNRADYEFITLDAGREDSGALSCSASGG